MKVVIDTDPGTDDAIALVAALNSPRLDILGLTTVGGNARLSHTTRNALRILEFMGRQDIPVYPGSSRPLKGRFEYAYGFHGPGGLTVRLPLPKTEAQAGSAVDFIIESARANRRDLTLIALGPLTNVAKALKREPRIVEWLNEIVVMGGALDVPGNVTPHAEFNIFDDPEAAKLVFDSDASIRLIGLDVCRKAEVTRADEDWFRGDSQGERLVSRIITGWLKMRGRDEAYSLCDPLAVAAAIRPDLFTFARGNVSVETDDSSRRGKTSAGYGTGNVMVATDVQAGEAKAFLRSMFT
ncbi:MAG: nucleoside hydrolase [Chloroflexi bacterium]|nr:nucleoside hydrolase [Chloroflexota bacterium]